MVAFLSAVPSVVEFSWPDITQKRSRPVTVKWATGENRAGRVTVSTGGPPQVVGPAAGSLSGEATFEIWLDQTATVELRSVDGATLFGTAVVTTKKDAFAEHMTDPNRKFIQNLSASAGIDSVLVRFQTPEPAIASILLRRRDNGAFAAVQTGQQLTQQHALSIQNLAQDTTFDLTIVALRRNPDNGGPIANNPVRVGTVVTGTRTVTVEWDLLWMRNDSDPGGTGEFALLVGAGGIGPDTTEGDHYFRDFPMLGDGGEWPLQGTVVIKRAPRTIWVMAHGQDDDNDPFSSFTLRGLWIEPGPPGTSGREEDDLAWAWVRTWIDTDQQAAGRSVPFVLATGTFAIAFTVFGSVKVERRDGRVTFPGLSLHRVKRDPRRFRSGSPIAAVKAALFPNDKGTIMVTKAPDGVLFISRATDRQAGTEAIAELGTFSGPITALMDFTGQVRVFATTEDAAVTAFRIGSGADLEPDSQSLGGSARTLAAAAAPGRVELFAVDGEGALSWLRLPLDAAAREWIGIDGGLTGDLVALAADSGDVGLFCRRTDGQVMHRLITDGGPAGEWDELGIAPHGNLVGEWVDEGRSVLLRSTAMGQDVGAMYWPGYPERGVASRWETLTPE